MKAKTIDVLISTYGERFKQIQAVLLPYNANVRYLIGHQGEGDSSLFASRKDVEIIYMNSIGVTKSRNELLQHTEADIIYFCDDDVKLNDNFYNILVDNHLKYSESVLTFKISNEFGCERKLFSKNSKILGLTSILSIGTIEISIKNHCRKFRFDEDMGAGTRTPLGDEAVYLSKLLKAGNKIRFVPEFICSHPDDSSGQNISHATIRSRALCLKRVFGIYSILVFPIFYIKNYKLFKGDTFFQSVKFFIMYFSRYFSK
ncbi:MULTISPECIES: glycosyltransferase family 2 protein [unclassified Pseudoalteromonas]|uniref:glycosyltransferase family 2 protein n=1 Tax=unclassified Pseudoalteromonas TaxID=194690 RepID=UPI00048E3A82|nr:MULTISPECIES: hypothetical protein [unclassified Pseudoalteromonas]